MSRNLLAIPPAPANQCISYGHDSNQFFDLYLPVAPSTIVMMIHGGFWRAKYDLQHTSHVCAALAKRGIAVANLEYRRVGNVGGGWPGTYEDVRAGYAALRKQFGDGFKCVVVGHSAGGHLGLRLAVDAKDLTAVVTLAPVAVLQTAFDLNLSRGAVKEFLGGTPTELPEIYAAACPSRHPSHVPRLLLHGDADTDVPIAISEEFAAARQNDSGTVRFMKLDETGHMDLVDPESHSGQIVLAEIEAFVAG